MKKYIFILILLISISAPGCLNRAPDENTGESVTYSTVPVDEAKTMVDSGEYYILDVRTQEEYDAGHIAGSVLIPHTELSDRLDEVPTEMPVLVYCKSGKRGDAASQILVDNGYSEVYNMQGGIIDWEKAGYPVEQ